MQSRYVKGPPPAWTAIGISRLYEPTAIVEVKVIARRRALHMAVLDRDESVDLAADVGVEGRHLDDIVPAHARARQHLGDAHEHALEGGLEPRLARARRRDHAREIDGVARDYRIGKADLLLKGARPGIEGHDHIIGLARRGGRRKRQGQRGGGERGIWASHDHLPSSHPWPER